MEKNLSKSEIAGSEKKSEIEILTSLQLGPHDERCRGPSEECVWNDETTMEI